MEGSKLKVDEFLTHIENEEQEYSFLLGEIYRIHEYIFETSNLAEIRGGSQLITLLITEKFEEIFGRLFEDVTNKDEFKKNKNNGFRIYNNAGNFLVIIPKRKKDELMAAINEQFYQETDIVTITYANGPILNFNENSPVPKDNLSKWIQDSSKEFQGNLKLIKLLKRKIPIEDRKKSFYPFIESNSIVKRCKSCGKRPAVTKSEHTPYNLCSVCYKKDKNRKKSFSIEKLAKKCNTLKKYVLPENEYGLPEDLDQLAGTSNYIALLYADGNEMGQAVFNSGDLVKFKELSQYIEERLQDSIIESIEPILKNNHKKLPFEILNMAGDDILMFIQGKYAFEFSSSLLNNFQNLFKEKFRNPTPTMSIGVTIFRKTYPIQYAFHITKSLLKNAKHFAKEQKESASALSYVYLKAPIAMYSSDVLLDYYYMSQHNVRLTMRPFTLTQFNKLREIAANIKEILPSSQREAILRSFDEKSLKATMNFIKYQIGRMKNGKDFLKEIKELKKIFKLKDMDGSDELPIWGKREIRGQEVRATPFLDLLELLEIEGGTHA
jgi:CRISPR/Cas system-associated protein Cas10 (large subunit of type III CRISPR-Cas system)